MRARVGARPGCTIAVVVACVLRASTAGGAATPHAAPMATPVASASDPSAELVHDHTPRHGGVVGMAGSRHVEAVLSADGVLRVYLTDLHRAPVPLGGVRAYATVRAAAGPVRIPLEVRDGALEGRVPRLGAEPVEVRVETDGPHGEPVLIDFTLP